jgi:hypothetical protein
MITKQVTHRDIGYPAEKPEKLERIDVKALVHYEKYGRKS